ncbi:hypothetical protein [Kitasatospora sp. NPDC015120]|uniref:hypothetical protein n=1 Tax=Kitasatospora sp. NPDC015120 TaxID=3364023 RepID=UPI0036F46AF2
MLADVASVATLVTVVVAVLSLRQIQRQRIRAFEDFYVARYWKLMDDLSLAVLRTRPTAGPVPLSEGDERVLRGYLVLCEDELELRAAGWISDRTWRIWSEAMRSQLAWQPVRQIWEKIGQGTGSGRPFHRLHRFQQGHHDPVELRRPGRILRGLRTTFGG